MLRHRGHLTSISSRRLTTDIYSTNVLQPLHQRITWIQAVPGSHQDRSQWKFKGVTGALPKGLEDTYLVIPYNNGSFRIRIFDHQSRLGAYYY
jgi:hypothetical protein